MKSLKYIFSIGVLAASALSIVSCEDMMDTKSDDYLFDDDLNMNSPSDSLTSVLGILSQQQSLAERYVLFGELRGDLISVPTNANLSLQEISQFNITAENSYYSKADYYKVINNCNYALSRMDPDLMIHNNKVMLSDYVGITSIRAWVQLQVAMAFGELTYYTEPINTVDGADADFPVLPFDAAVDQILADIEPYIGMDVPNFGSIDGYGSTEMFIRPTLLAADLYLYKNNYERAAQLYYDYIDRYNCTINSDNANRYTGTTWEGIWGNHNSTYNNEVISRIVFPSDGKDYHPQLINMTFNLKPQLLPAKSFMDEMASKSYYHVDWLSSTESTSSTEGDLRGMAILAKERGDFAGAFGYTHVNDDQNSILITKFYNNGNQNGNVSIPDNDMFDHIYAMQTRSIAIYRTPTLYLPYAEAVNRTGRPNMAFQVLKNGLQRKIVQDPLMIPAQELEGGELWLNFENGKFDNSYGTAMRGRGWGIRLKSSDYVIPEMETLQDSIEWVENEIVYEMAAETCFEGNRFFDLMRVSHHRADHPAYMAEKISRRFENPAAIKSRLMNQESWWIK